jgi:hypothetical protein
VWPDLFVSGKNVGTGIETLIFRYFYFTRHPFSVIYPFLNHREVGERSQGGWKT